MNHEEFVVGNLQERQPINPEEHIHFNFDPIARETYERFFERVVHRDDTVVNIGPGFALNKYADNYLNEQIWNVTRDNDAHLVLADISHEDLLTQKDLKEVTESEHVSVVEADALNLPLKDESVSGITSSNLINCPNEDISLHEQAEKLLDEAWRVLKPGGFIVISSFGYLREGRDEKGKIYNDYIREEDVVTLEDLEKMLNEKGFANIAELDVDWERLEKNILQWHKRGEEIGGFVAYKPTV